MSYDEMRDETKLLMKILLVMYTFFLAQIIVTALVFSSFFEESYLISLAGSISKTVPGLRSSFSNVVVLGKSEDAARFVVSQFWGFSAASALSIIFFLVSIFLRFADPADTTSEMIIDTKTMIKNDIRDSGEVRSTVPNSTPLQKLSVFMTPVVFGLIFFFVPLAYTPGPGTSYSKALQGSVFGAGVVNVFWGITLLLALLYIKRRARIYRAPLS